MVTTRSRTKSTKEKFENGTAHDMTSEAGSEKLNPTIYVVFVGLLIDLLGFTLILPLFPRLLDHYRENDSSGLFPFLQSQITSFQKAVGAPDQFNSVLFGGLLGSLFSYLQFMSSPIIGGLSDFFGRKPLLILSTIGITASYAIWAISDNFALFVLSRIVGGVSKGNVSLSTAIVIDSSTKKTRGKGMALVGIAFSIGFVIGPMIGAGFSAWSHGRSDDWYFYPAITAFAFGISDFLFLLLFFKESLPAKRRKSSASSSLLSAFTYINPISLFSFSPITKVSKANVSSLRKIGLGQFLYLFFYSGLEFTLTFLTHIRFNFTSMQQGRMFLFIGLIMSLVNGGYIRRISPGREKSVCLQGLALIIPSFVIIGFAKSLPVLYLGLAIYSFSSATVVWALTTLISQYGSHDEKGIITGIFRSLGALGRALGPTFISVLYWIFGAEVCYAVGAVGLILPLLIVRKV